MTTYKPIPTYFRVTWNQSSPNDYTNLAGNRAGGVDPTTAYQYNNSISITGHQPILSTPFSDGDSFFLNGQEISFTSSDTLADVISKINLYSIETSVIAHDGVQTNYVTLTNASGHSAEKIEVAEGTGALAILGFDAGAYRYHPSDVGTTYTNFTNGDSFVINGITITMTTAGGLDQTGAVSTINMKTSQTGVIAYRAGTKIQLASIYGQPWALSGSNVTKLGFPVGTGGGHPTNITLSIRKSYANMRWQQVVNQLEIFSTPFMLNDILGTGNYDGQTELTTLGFTIGYEHPDQLVTEDELNPGTMLSGTAAIRRAVARGLTATYTRNVDVFDPTIETRGSYAVRPNPLRINKLAAAGIDTFENIATLEENISVSMISFTG